MREWERNIRKVDPYVPGEQPKFSDMIKLNTNENPYPPSPKVAEKIKKLNADKSRLYPAPACDSLISAISDYYGLNEDEVFVGVGSDDVLAVAFMTFFNGSKPVLFPDITYSFYDVWANLFRIPFETQPLDDNFNIRKEDYYKENGGVVIANPNAPTSVCVDVDFIRDILDHNKESVVIIDEAYIDFGGESALPLINEYDNLLVVQTFSKSRSMAGMRIGYAMGNAKLIKAMQDVKYSYNSYTMNYTSLELGAEAIKDDAYFKSTNKKIINTRERVMKELKELGFTFPDSKANFLFITHKSVSANELFKALRKENIFVRYFDKPRINNYLRVTIGTDEEMNTFLDFLRKYIK